MVRDSEYKEACAKSLDVDTDGVDTKKGQTPSRDSRGLSPLDYTSGLK